MNPIVYTIAVSNDDLQGILRLQQENLPRSVSHKEALEQGFVTVEHNFSLLRQMNAPYPHIIAKYGEQVVGYALTMLRDLRTEIPVLLPMFDQIDRIEYRGKPVEQARYFIMGQICVAKPFQRLGLFKGLYKEMSKRMSPDFDYIITEVSLRNQRSLQAHLKAGFKTIMEYSSEDGEEWAIVLMEI